MSTPVGTEGQAWEVVVERGKIREFAAAMQSDLPDYQGAGAVVPPTFLASAVQWAPEGVRIGHGFDRRRLLHGEQEYRFFGPPPKVGQVLRARDRVEDRYEKPGKRGGTMRFVVIVTEFRDEADTVVAEARATYIETAKPAKEDA